MIERAQLALGGFAVDLYVTGDTTPRRIPLKKLRAPAELLRDDPLHLTDAAPAGDRVRLMFSDGKVLETDPLAPPGPDFDVVIYNTAAVLTMKEPSAAPLGRVDHACVALRGGRVAWIGPQAELPSQEIGPKTERIDAGGGLVTPGLVDPHTHPVFGGQRAREFALRAAGKSYQDIHAAGGGIFSTVEATRAASAAELLHGARARLSRMLGWGTTSCEGKSGYALLPDGERLLLEVIAQAAAGHAVDISPTLLAHAVPPEFADRRDRYLELYANLAREAVRHSLADSCDVFCDQGAFTLEESRTILTAAKAAGLAPRLHAEQLTQTGAAELAAQLGARSADHLEYVSDGAMVMMARAGVVATLLPGAAMTLRLPWPPARKLIDSGVRVALGTDCNPGSSMTECLPLQMSIACMQMGLTVEEAWMGVTVNAARAIGRADLGHLSVGARADLCIFACDDPAYVPYHYATNHLRLVMKDGQVGTRS